MPRKIVWPPKVILHAPSGQARCRFGGAYTYLGPYGSDTAAQRYAQLVAQHAPGRKVVRTTGGATVSTVVAAFLEHARGEYSERGGECRQFKMALAPLVRLYGPTPAAQFGLAELEAYQSAVASGSWLTEEERKAPARRGGSNCKNVVNARVRRVRLVWRWAEQRGLVPPGSWAHLKALSPIRDGSKRARKTPPVAPARLGDLCRVLRHCHRPAVRAILRLLWHAGMRTGEACRMRPCEIDRTGEVWFYRPAIHKCDWRGQDRTVGLGPAAQRVLGKWLARSKAPGDCLFTNRKGGAYTAKALGERVREAARAAGVTLRAGQVRHAYRKRVTAALSLDAARASMGHLSMETTIGYGKEADLRLIEEVAKRLG